MKLIRCNRVQYLKRCDTKKAYAVQYSRFGNGNIMFLSKKHVKFMPEEDEFTGILYYWFEIPDWLYNKMSDDDKEDIKLFDEDASRRVAEHDEMTEFKRWYSNKETCQHIKPFG